MFPGSLFITVLCYVYPISSLCGSSLCILAHLLSFKDSIFYMSPVTPTAALEGFPFYMPPFYPIVPHSVFMKLSRSGCVSTHYMASITQRLPVITAKFPLHTATENNNKKTSFSHNKHTYCKPQAGLAQAV
jgi:hypothetical protein